MARPETNAVVTQRIDAAPGLMILRVAPDGWKLPDFTPGQFAVIGLPGRAPRTPWSDPEEKPPDPDRMIRRAYSIASSSLSRDHLELFITLVRSAELTPRLFALQAGDRLWLGPKLTGMFTMREVPHDQHIVMVATGTGMAPYMSMLRTELAGPAPRRYAVLAGARHSWDLAYSAELVTMARLAPKLAYLPTVSRPQEEPAPWGGATGYVQALWTGGALERAWGFRPTPRDTHVFLCGNPGMIDEMVKALAAEGFSEQDARNPGGTIHVERYW
jgi:ferredoxin--NADP+ reductase